MQNLEYHDKTWFCVDKPSFSIIVILGLHCKRKYPGFSHNPIMSTEKPGFAEKNLVYQSKTRFIKSQNQVFLHKPGFSN